MVYMSQLRMGDRFTVNGSDVVFKYTHRSRNGYYEPAEYTYHATLESVHCQIYVVDNLMFNDILVNKVETPKEPKQIPIIYSVEDYIKRNSYVKVMLRNGFEFLGSQKFGITYQCIKTGKLYTAPMAANYTEAHTIWLTEYVE